MEVAELGHKLKDSTAISHSNKQLYIILIGTAKNNRSHFRNIVHARTAVICACIIMTNYIPMNLKCIILEMFSLKCSPTHLIKIIFIFLC